MSRRTSSAVPFRVGGVDDVFAADLVAEARADPPRDADDHRRLVLDRQQSDRLVGRGGPAEEVDVEPALAGVLIGQEREDAIVLEDLEHLVVAAGLGDQLLAGPLAERAEVAVEIGVVERAGHRDGGKAEHAEEVAGHLPVAVVAGQEDQRAFPAHEVVEKIGSCPTSVIRSRQLVKWSLRGRWRISMSIMQKCR